MPNNREIMLNCVPFLKNIFKKKDNQKNENISPPSYTTKKMYDGFHVKYLNRMLIRQDTRIFQFKQKGLIAKIEFQPKSNFFLKKQ